MAPLVDGTWQDTWFDTAKSGGRFERRESTFRDWIRADGSTRFQPERGRYHLYVSLACPWAHRTLIVRHLKGLEAVISVDVVHPYMGAEGWSFNNPDATAEASADTVNGAQFLHQVYTAADPRFSGRVTVPVLWDRKHGTIVNNESADIVRMLNADFENFASTALDLYPAPLRKAIDTINQPVYEHVNNGVYRCGFATTQSAYAEAYADLFATLDMLDARLGNSRYLVGDTLTEADWRLFTTLVRFDAVYVGHFKCNHKRIVDYPHLQRYLVELYAQPGIASTVNMEHIKRHYYESHPTLNPSGIVPLGPALAFT